MRPVWGLSIVASMFGRNADAGRGARQPGFLVVQSAMSLREPVLQATSPLVALPRAAIDFGISNTDVVTRVGSATSRWTEPYRGDPDESSVRDTLARADIVLESLPHLAVTGGRHRLLPDRLAGVSLIKVSEVEAIGRGGQAILGLEGTQRDEPILVVSAGSGTAMIKAQGNRYAHVSGTGVGGGTMLGFGRLLLGTSDPVAIGELASHGDRNGVDLRLADVITGPIGSLPADATAVNFGRVGRSTFEGDVKREDVAAGLVNLIAQTISLIAANAARAQQCQRIVMVGHMLDVAYFRHVVALVGAYYATTFELPEHPGTATALGALALAGDQA
ncbi:MAG: Fumble domain-containing protein [Gemmatimonas sp.]